MPLYEYRCEGCGGRFEALRRMGDDTGGLACPACGGAALTREFSTFSRAVVGGSMPAACAPSGGFS